jgi:hypothetical protein
MMTITSKATRPLDAHLFALMAFLMLWSVLLSSTPVNFQLPFIPSESSDAQSANITWVDEQVAHLKQQDMLKEAQIAQSLSNAGIQEPSKEIGFPLMLGAENHNPVRFRIPSRNIDAVVTSTTYDNTIKGAVCWKADSVSLGEFHNLLFWGFDIGWSNPSDMPLANLSQPMTMGMELIIEDESGNLYTYKLNNKFFTANTDLSVMDAGDREMITVLGSAGEKIYRDGKLVDTTMRAVYRFIPADVYDAGK